MIKLHAFGPMWGLPDPSPFVIKAETLLKMSGQPYEKVAGNLLKAPKKKLPIIEDDGQIIADSTFIRDHLERKYIVDFDAGLSDVERAQAWALQAMVEERLYWTIVHQRWMKDDNFKCGPATFFKAIPRPIRWLVVPQIRKSVRKALYGQGLGRHCDAEILLLAKRDLEAIAITLGDKPFLFGVQPAALDASVFGLLWGCLCPIFSTPLIEAVQQHDVLVRYVARMVERFYPEYKAKV